MKHIYVLFLMTFLSSNSQIINFPDPALKARLLSSSADDPEHAVAYVQSGSTYVPVVLDTNGDGEVQVSEALAIHSIILGSDNSYAFDITDLTGIEQFTNLISFSCRFTGIEAFTLSGPPSLRSLVCGDTSLDGPNTVNLSGFPNLENLNCWHANISSLDLSVLPNLKQLECRDNNLTALDISQNPALEWLMCFDNHLVTLDMSANPVLTTVACGQNYLTSIIMGPAVVSLEAGLNELTSIDISDHSLYTLKLNNNDLTSIDLSNQTMLGTLYLDNNNLTAVDMTASQYLSTLRVGGNPELTTLLIKNGGDEQVFLNNLPNLHYICADDVDLPAVQALINQYNYNCEVNSYCSFTPGGAYYPITGSTKFDGNSDGCAAADPFIQSMNFTISNGTTSGSTFANNSGNFSIPVAAGTHTITPQIANPSFFNISPSSVTVTFPTDGSSLNQNFCITPNGVHNDLSIVAIPIGQAVPGFIGVCQVTIKNNGNQLQSGSVNFTFDDALMDFVSASAPGASASAGTVSWTFANLLPFESQIATVMFELNTPTESPALNGGDVLQYAAAIVTSATDESPSDNSTTFVQTAVNSMDPNHKTCTEGATIAPTMVGEYVHYVIQFENVGTFPATNVVVKDMIDTSKFDVSTLVPVASSHSYTARITGNKVEFIFQGINLPFDDANNDGYFAFKIKTKPTLVIGDTFSNTASIYFDYNFPIITNTETTLISNLGNQDFEFSRYLTVYPNPANDLLNIKSADNIALKSIGIYNMIGQQLIMIPNAIDISSVDVTPLKLGTYFVTVTTDKGTSAAKFVKQ